MPKTTSGPLVNNKPKDKKTIKIFTITTLIVICAALVFIFSGGLNMVEQKRMESYLKDRYREDFKVINIRTEGSGLGVRGEIKADANPKNNPSVKFTVSSKSDGYDDTYPTVLWSVQGREEVELFLTENIGKSIEFILDIGPKTILRQGGINHERIPAGKIVPVDKALSKYGNVLIYSLSVKNKSSAESISGDDHLKLAYSIVQFVKSKGIDSEVNYLYQTSLGNFSLNLKKDDIKSIDQYEDLIKYRNQLSLDEVSL